MTKNTPVQTYKIGYLTAAVWKNDNFYSVTITRSFRNAEGEWNDTHSFNHQDLPVLATLADACESYIRAQAK